jgi:hypothetical protein
MVASSSSLGDDLDHVGGALPLVIAPDKDRVARIPRNAELLLPILEHERGRVATPAELLEPGLRPGPRRPGIAYDVRGRREEAILSRCGLKKREPFLLVERDFLRKATVIGRP